MAEELGRLTGARIDVIPVRNSVFGERVNVSGLLCGQDYLGALAGSAPDCFILPRASLDYFGQKFLDSMTIEEVELALGRPLTFASQWSEVLDILARGPRRPTRNEATNGAFWSEDRAQLPRGSAWVRA
jgi:NifB/MoaA-like Fe-S oxidoreductase